MKLNEKPTLNDLCEKNEKRRNYQKQGKNSQFLEKISEIRKNNAHKWTKTLLIPVANFHNIHLYLF